MKIRTCRLNHMENPLGYSLDSLAFSWKAEETRGKRAESSRLQIARSPDFCSCLYDSGPDDLDSRGTQVRLTLMPRTRYYWKVGVWTELGETAESDVQWFETAKMDEPWEAAWITCDAANPRHPVFRKNLSFDREIASARLYICGLGLYEAYLNGNKIGDEYLTPHCNDYFTWLQYQTYDITEALTAESQLDILLGNGWYKGRFGYDVKKNRTPVFSETWKLIADLRIQYRDGTEEVIGTDESWMVWRSQITFSDLYDGEHVDARLPELPEESAVLCEEEMAELVPRYSVPVRAIGKITPRERIRTPAGEWVLDLGQNQAGIFEFTVEEPAGTEVILEFGEILQNGNFYRENLRGARAEYRFLSDGKKHVLKPHFTFYGYRYVRIQGVRDPKKEDYTALVLSSDLAVNGRLTTGNEKLNRLIQNVEWSLKSNFIDIPMDCPQRDERMGWTGDAQVFSGTASYLRDAYPFYRKYLKDMSEEQRKDGGRVPNVIPAAGYDGCSSAWGDAACMIPWNMYLYTGDSSILRERFSDMKAWVDYITRVDGENHGWRRHFHYGDWLALDHPSGDPTAYRGATEEGLIADAYYRNSALIVAKSARLLGDPTLAAEYEALADRILEGLREEYFTPSGRCCQGTQTSHILSLYYGLSEHPEKEKEQLIRSLEATGRSLRTGFVGSLKLCPVLTQIGRSDLAYHFLLNEEYPGWLYEVNLGATTIWERWNSVLPDGRVNPSGMNSLNHYCYGSILEWMFQTVAGIAPMEEAPGFQKARIMPIPDSRLGKAEAVIDSASGIWKIGWELRGEELEIRIQVPFDCEGELILPKAPTQVYGDPANPMFRRVENEICLLEAGTYRVCYHPTGDFAHRLEEIPGNILGGL